MAIRRHGKGRARILLLFKGDLRFLALAILVLESLIGVGALRRNNGTQGTFLMMSAVAILASILLLVGITRLYEKRCAYAEKLKKNDRFAIGLGEEIYAAFDGSLHHLNEVERDKAYEILRDGMKYSPHAQSNAEKHFVELVVSTVARKAQLRCRWAMDKDGKEPRKPKGKPKSQQTVW